MVDQNLLGDEHDTTGRLESFGVERAVLAAKLHQVDARQIAGRVVQEHIFGTRIRGVDSTRVGARVPAIDRRVVLHARVAAAPGRMGHPLEHLAGLIDGAFFRLVGDPMRGPTLVLLDGPHELIADANRQVGVLEGDRVVGLLRVVAFFDQQADLSFFLVLAFGKLHHVGVPVLDRLHLGGPTRLAAALDHRGNLVVHPHKRQRPGRAPAAGKLLAMRTQRGNVGPRAGTELEEHGLAAGEFHDVFHVVLHALNEAGRGLGIFVRVLRLAGRFRLAIPVPVAHVALHAVLVEQSDVEPHGRVERGVLVQAEPSQLAIEVFAVFGRGEIAVFSSPVGDRAAHTVDQSPNALLTLGRAVLAVEVLVDHDVGGQLTP